MILGVAGLAPNLAPGPALAQAQAPVVAEIRVEGNQRIEPATVVSYLAIAVGDTMQPDLIDRSLKALFATSLFADVTMRREGNVLVVRVLENPVINRIAFEGNFSINDELLSAEVQLRPRVVFTRSRVQSDVQRLIQVYQRSGRFAVTVEPKVIQLEQNRVDLVFEVNEGPLTGVRRIRFIGNQAYDDRKLREAIQTRESRWWRWLTSDDTYDPDRVSFDQELLRSYYTERGYADFRVVSAVAQLTPDGSDFFLTFTVDEGRRYRFGEFEIISEVPDLDISYLRTILRGETGATYNSTEIEDSVLDLTFELGRFGYAFVDIIPRLARNREAGTIDVTYEIAEGPRAYVDRINITGNVRTLDRVIRREFRIAEGDAFNAAKIQRSVQRVRSLGFFDRVDVSQAPSDSVRSGAVGAVAPVDDRIDLNMDVRERSTGDLIFGVGYSTVDAFVTDFTISERNLLGRGQDLSVSFTLATRRQQFDLSFTEPYFLGRRLSAGFDLFTVRNDFQDISSFTENRRGFGLRTGFPLTENLSAGLRYSLRQDIIEDVGANASQFVRQQQGSRVLSTIGYSLLYDVRDDSFSPTEGYALRFAQEFAGVGGSVKYLRTTASAQVHFPVVRDDWIASLTAEEGIITGLGDDVAITDRFFLGGNDFRGFARAGLGPRDTLTNDALGGKVYFITSAELAFPVGLPEDSGVRGSVFTDIGTLSRPGITSPTVKATGSVRVSYGFGLSWTSPLGPLRFDWAWPLRKESWDREETFRFSFGTRF